MKLPHWASQKVDLLSFLSCTCICWRECFSSKQSKPTRTWRWTSWRRTRMSLERRMRLLLRCTGEWRSPSRTWSVSFEVFINQIFLTCLVGKSVLPSGRPLSWRTCSERLWKSPARITSKRSTRQGTESGWCCTSTNQGLSEILKTLDRTKQMFFNKRF